MYCPVCKTVELKMSDRSGVEIDYCPQCRGVWLDRGELDKIIERSADHDRQLASSTPRDEVVYEQRKRKNDEPVDYDRYDDDDYDERRYRDSGDPRQRKKRGFLEDIFDIFD